MCFVLHTEELASALAKALARALATALARALDRALARESFRQGRVQSLGLSLAIGPEQDFGQGLEVHQRQGE